MKMGPMRLLQRIIGFGHHEEEVIKKSEFLDRQDSEEERISLCEDDSFDVHFRGDKKDRTPSSLGHSIAHSLGHSLEPILFANKKQPRGHLDMRLDMEDDESSAGWVYARTGSFKADSYVSPWNPQNRELDDACYTKMSSTPWNEKVSRGVDDYESEPDAFVTRRSSRVERIVNKARTLSISLTPKPEEDSEGEMGFDFQDDDYMAFYETAPRTKRSIRKMMPYMRESRRHHARWTPEPQKYTPYRGDSHMMPGSYSPVPWDSAGSAENSHKDLQSARERKSSAVPPDSFSATRSDVSALGDDAKRPERVRSDVSALGDDAKRPERVSSVVSALDDDSKRPERRRSDVSALSNDSKRPERVRSDVSALSDDLKRPEYVNSDVTALGDDSTRREHVSSDVSALGDDSKRRERVNSDVSALDDDSKRMERIRSNVSASDDDSKRMERVRSDVSASDNDSKWTEPMDLPHVSSAIFNINDDDPTPSGMLGWFRHVESQALENFEEDESEIDSNETPSDDNKVRYGFPNESAVTEASVNDTVDCNDEHDRHLKKEVLEEKSTIDPKLLETIDDTEVEAEFPGKDCVRDGSHRLESSEVTSERMQDRCSSRASDKLHWYGSRKNSKDASSAVVSRKTLSKALKLFGGDDSLERSERPTSQMRNRLRPLFRGEGGQEGLGSQTTSKSDHLGPELTHFHSAQDCAEKEDGIVLQERSASVKPSSAIPQKLKLRDLRRFGSHRRNLDAKFGFTNRNRYIYNPSNDSEFSQAVPS